MTHKNTSKNVHFFFLNESTVGNPTTHKKHRTVKITKKTKYLSCILYVVQKISIIENGALKWQPTFTERSVLTTTVTI